MVPSCERIRFTSSGTEATLMAVRLARAFTGRPKLLRFKGHFHGWHDHMTAGSPAISTARRRRACWRASPRAWCWRRRATWRRWSAAGDRRGGGGDPGADRRQLRPGAAAPEFLRALRRLTERHGTLLILDEVVTGFRIDPGGAQAAFGVRPDLSTLAKIVAGGMPGAAVGGRKEILDLLDFAAAPAAGREKIGHQGTYNANPVAAAAGIACLRIVERGAAIARADATAAELRAALNAVLAEERLPWAAYGASSSFHVFLNPAGRDVTPERFDPFDCTMQELKSPPARLVSRLRLALLLHGVDVNSRLSGFTSAAHDAADVAEVARALRASLRMLRDEGEL